MSQRCKGSPNGSLLAKAGRLAAEFNKMISASGLEDCDIITRTLPEPSLTVVELAAPGGQQLPVSRQTLHLDAVVQCGGPDQALVVLVNH